MNLKISVETFKGAESEYACYFGFSICLTQFWFLRPEEGLKVEGAKKTIAFYVSELQQRYPKLSWAQGDEHVTIDICDSVSLVRRSYYTVAT